MNTDLIIVIAVVVISIISSIVKAGKKKAEETAREHLPQSEDPWSSIIEEIEKHDRPASVTGTEEHAKKSKYFTYDDNVISEGEKNTSHKKQIIDSKNEGRVKSDIRQQSKKIEQEGAEVADPVVDDFDLRTAVIYSEILKPKFEE